MKKILIYFVLFSSVLIFGLVKEAKSDEYTKAVIGHVVTQKITGQNIDSSKLMEQELERIAHQFTIEMIVVMQKYLPSILDGIASDLRMKSDEKYKCELLKGSANGCI